MASLDRIRRLLRLVEFLQSGRSYNAGELAELCGVSRRTIFRDLNLLQDSGIPVHFNEGRRGYSLPTSLYLPSTDLTLNEALSLLLLCHELGNEQRGIPFQSSARSAVAKLLSTLPQHLREYVGELAELVQVRAPPHNLLHGAGPVYETLMQALGRRRRVRILYRSLTEWRDITTLLSPYRLLFVRRSWYAIGRSSLHRSVRTFNLGRILKAEIINRSYEIPRRFSLDRYLGNAWSLIRERGKRFEVVVRFQPKVAYNVAEVQWHKTQRLVWNDDGTLDFHVTVDGLQEIVWWILGYGDQAEVLEPPELRDEVRRHAEAMRKKYARKKAHRKTARKSAGRKSRKKSPSGKRKSGGKKSRKKKPR